VTTYPAQIVFVESDRGHRWVGRLLRPDLALDTQTGRPVAQGASLPFFRVVENPQTRSLYLRGVPLKNTRCAVYEDRPSVCRGFKPGGAGCLATRRLYDAQ